MKYLGTKHQHVKFVRGEHKKLHITAHLITQMNKENAAEHMSHSRLNFSGQKIKLTRELDVSLGAMFVITQNILAQRKEGRRKEQVSAEIGALPSSVYFQASALYLPLFRWYGKTLNPVCGHCSEFPSFEPGDFSDTVLVRECDETVLRIESSMWR